jgi:hypothetical protein
MTWNFFATGHGKGEVDGAGALFKREVHKEQIKPDGVRLQNTAEVIAFLKAETNKFHAGNPGARQLIRKHFWDIEVGAIDRSRLFNCATVARSRGMHQVRSLINKDPTLIQYRQLSCSCLACTSRTPAFECEQRDHVPPWRLYRLQPQNTREVKDMMYDSDEDVRAQGGLDNLCEDVHVGENVAIPTDLRNEPFWILLCDKAVHVVQESFIDAWDNSFVIGDGSYLGIILRVHFRRQ